MLKCKYSRKGVQKTDLVMVLQQELNIPSLGISLGHHLANCVMLKNYPQDMLKCYPQDMLKSYPQDMLKRFITAHEFPC